MALQLQFGCLLHQLCTHFISRRHELAPAELDLRNALSLGRAMGTEPYAERSLTASVLDPLQTLER
jgi:hypothetical protein